jgi:hypothetical protein
MKLGLSRNTIRVRPQYRSPPITLQGEFASGQRLTDLSSVPDDDRRDGAESSEDGIEIFDKLFARVHGVTWAVTLYHN